MSRVRSFNNRRERFGEEMAAAAAEVPAGTSPVMTAAHPANGAVVPGHENPEHKKEKKNNCILPWVLFGVSLFLILILLVVLMKGGKKSNITPNRFI